MNTKSSVKQLLEDKINRNSDKALYLNYLEREGVELSLSQKAKIMRLSSPETISRIRRKFQEDGMYPADEDVDNARFDKFKEVKNNTYSPEAIHVALDMK